MNGRLVQVGEKATRELAEAGGESTPVFDSAAAEAARAARFSDDEIIDMLGYLPPLLVPAEPTAAGSAVLRK